MRASLKKGLCAALLVLVPFSPAKAQDSKSPDHVGMWHFHSAKGYQGYVLLDGMGGCSYFLSSVALTIQATCIARMTGPRSMVIFGSQEGVGSTAPVYGDQLANPALTNQAAPSSTAVSFHISQMERARMSGALITSAGREAVSFRR